IPLRSPKMYSFILGFQRLVWCPKWTPASSSSFIVILAKLPPYWIASSAADCPLGIDSLVRSRRSGREDFWPRFTASHSPLAGPQAEGKIDNLADPLLRNARLPEGLRPGAQGRRR